MRAAKVLCHDIRIFEFLTKKTLAIKNPGVTIQKNEHVFDNKSRHFHPKNHNCREKWDMTCHLRCIMWDLLFWSLIAEQHGMKRL